MEKSKNKMENFWSLLKNASSGIAGYSLSIYQLVFVRWVLLILLALFNIIIVLLFFVIVYVIALLLKTMLSYFKAEAPLLLGFNWLFELMPGSATEEVNNLLSTPRTVVGNSQALIEKLKIELTENLDNEKKKKVCAILDQTAKKIMEDYNQNWYVMLSKVYSARYPAIFRHTFRLLKFILAGVFIMAVFLKINMIKNIILERIFQTKPGENSCGNQKPANSKFVLLDSKFDKKYKLLDQLEKDGLELKSQIEGLLKTKHRLSYKIRTLKLKRKLLDWMFLFYRGVWTYGVDLVNTVKVENLKSFSELLIEYIKTLLILSNCLAFSLFQARLKIFLRLKAMFVSNPNRLKTKS